MAQSSKYPFNKSDANTGEPSASLRENGWTEDQVLGSLPLNVFMAQGSNWSADFKTISTISSSTLDIAASTECEPFDFIMLTNPSGCVVNFDLTTIGTGKFSIGQIITIYNSSSVNSSYQVNGNAPEEDDLIHPNELVKIMILNNTTVLNLSSSKDTTPVGKIEYRLTYENRRGWLNINNDSDQKTIGASSSPAGFNSDKFQALFVSLWNSASDSIYPVTPGGRGASAEADFADNKIIDISIISNCVFSMDGSSISARDRYGASSITLTEAQLPEIDMNSKLHDDGHQHETGGTDSSLSGGGVDNLSPGGSGNNTASSTTGITIDSFGQGQPVDVRQLTFVPFAYIKY